MPFWFVKGFWQFGHASSMWENTRMYIEKGTKALYLVYRLEVHTIIQMLY